MLSRCIIKIMALVYSCCFWFSLRLGGILIAIFSILQGLAVLVCCCIAQSQEQHVKDSTAALIDSVNLIYTKPYIDNFHADPQKYLLLAISFSCIYILLCLCYAYGAYKFNNIFMIGYILVELLRLIFLAFVITTWLLVLKENTMDIGVHIGTSVVGSFFLLGMFYLWTCAANLPILINEMERDQQKATIYQLQKLLNINNITSDRRSQNTGVVPLEMNLHRTPLFTTTNFQKNIYNQTFDNNSHYSKSFYSRFNH